jgi:glutamine amidotransferase
MSIAIIDYGAGNIQSIRFAMERLGFSTILTNKVNEIQQADRVIFPGVGEASSAMTKLQASRLDTLIPTLTQPVLGICLGMQLLCNHTEEGNTKGLGIFDTEVKRFDNQLKVPHMGWNTSSHVESGLFEDIGDQSYFYMVHSYYAKMCDQTIASMNYGLEFSTALQKDNFYGVQFHPEKSSKAGAQLLQNFLEL